MRTITDTSDSATGITPDSKEEQAGSVAAITTRPGQQPNRGGMLAVGIVLVLGLIVAAVVAFAAIRPSEATPIEPQVTVQTLEVDIAEDGTRFVWDEAPVYEDGLPKYGNAFVTQGYIYEAGAIAAGAGVNADGSPTDPDKVLGTWTCEGHFIGQGATTENGPWVVSKQIFDFGDQPGAETVVTQGLELADHEVAGLRAIVGGTGPLRSVTGEAGQVLHGHNDSEGVQLTMVLDMEIPGTDGYQPPVG